MNLKFNRRYFILSILLALIILPSASALIFNEIMYDLPGSDTGREWIEVYNDGPEPLNLSGWKLFEAGTNHGLTLISGSFVLNSGEYAAIIDDPTKFSLDNPLFSGNVYDSSFSLSNTGENLSIKNSSLGIVSSISYLSLWGGNGNNNSLQYNGTGWCESTPTIGKVNLCTTSIPIPEQNNINQTVGNNQNSGLNQSQQQQNQSSNSNSQNQTQVDYCSGIQVVNLTKYPSALKFGTADKVVVNFKASCYPENYTQMLVYGSMSRVISYENGEKITSYASCQQGAEFDNLTSKDYTFEVPFYVYPNCDSYYKDGDYSISLRICDSNGLKYYETDFNASISGINAGACSNQTEESSFNLDGTPDENNTGNESLDKKNNFLPPSKSVKLSGGVKGIGSGSTGTNSSSANNGQIVYQSSEIKSLSITTYLAGILFVLICAYLIANKGKI